MTSLRPVLAAICMGAQPSYSAHFLIKSATGWASSASVEKVSAFPVDSSSSCCHSCTHSALVHIALVEQCIGYTDNFIAVVSKATSHGARRIIVFLHKRNASHAHGMHTHMHACTNRCARTYTYTYAYTHAHACMHTLNHSRKHACTPSTHHRQGL